MSTSKRILMLYWYHVPLYKMRLAIRQHIQTMDSSPQKHEIVYHNVYENTQKLRALNFDAVILHNTFLCMRWNTLFYRLKSELEWVREMNCIKIAIPQDEYDHSEVLDEWLFEWQVPIIFSCFDATDRKTLYPLMADRANFYKCLTGYIDDAIAAQIQPNLLPLSKRSNDIVYRASKLPYWFGSHGQLKHQIGGIVANCAKLHGLVYDISTREADTIVGEAWVDFIASGRTVIGCESGSSALDRRGEIKSKIEALLAENNGLSFDEVSAQLPRGWDDFSFFAVSPRHLEAVITKTCQVLIEGRYDGILEPNKHYIPLKKDFSDLDEVLDKLRDNKLLERIANQAYEEICMSGQYSYKKFASDIDRAIAEAQ
jgi:hypothetical protein